jgi:hypothetical protein
MLRPWVVVRERYSGISLSGCRLKLVHDYPLFACYKHPTQLKTVELHGFVLFAPSQDGQSAACPSKSVVPTPVMGTALRAFAHPTQLKTVEPHKPSRSGTVFVPDIFSGGWLWEMTSGINGMPDLLPLCTIVGWAKRSVPIDTLPMKSKVIIT